MTAGLLTGVLYLVAVVISVGICAAKGKPWLAIAGVLLSPAWSCVGAIRLAKPGSRWAGRYYDSDKLAYSRRRFPDLAPLPHEQDSEPWPYDDPKQADRITRRAIRRQQRGLD